MDGEKFLFVSQLKSRHTVRKSVEVGRIMGSIKNVEASASAGNNPRLLKEQFLQVLTVGISILDRILLTAVFYRFWGVNLFESWSVFMSIAGLVGLAEFGFSSYFRNTISAAIHQHEHDKARKLLKTGFTLLSLSALAGLAIVVPLGWVLQPNSDNSQTSSMLVVLFLAFALAPRIATSCLSALYRAHLEYARYTLIFSLGEVTRILLIFAIVIVAEGGHLAAAVASFLAINLFHFIVITLDARHRFPEYTLGWSLPNLPELREILTTSTGFFFNTIAAVLLTSLPVLLLNGEVESAGLIASFVVIRTLTGLPRTLAQSVSVVIGFETSRQIAQKEMTQAWDVFYQSVKTSAVAAGVITALLINFSQQIVVIWMGDTALYNPNYLFVACAPLVLVSVAFIAHNVLITAHKAFHSAIARIAQVLIMLVVFWALPKSDPALSMLIALSVGEVAGFAMVTYYLLRKLLAPADFVFHLKMVLITMSVLLVIVTIDRAVSSILDENELWDIALRFLISTVAGTLLFISFGLNAEQRQSLLPRLFKKWWDSAS